MGALPKLAIKGEIRYRKGSTNESQNCRHCENFRRDYHDALFAGGPDKFHHRCTLVGLKISSRYRVWEDYTCDRQKISTEYRASFANMRNEMNAAKRERAAEIC